MKLKGIQFFRFVKHFVMQAASVHGQSRTGRHTYEYSTTMEGYYLYYVYYPHRPNCHSQLDWFFFISYLVCCLQPTEMPRNYLNF